MAQSNIESAADQSSTSFTASSPKIELPKGGGAIRGIGEKFAANPVTGTGSMTVPIATSPGRSGFGPQLSLSYDSGSGNGPFGFGWSLSLPSITRKTDKGLPQYLDATDSDEFILSGAEDLVPVFKKENNGDWVFDGDGCHVIDEEDRDGYRIRRYRPRIEGLFARIERWTQLSDGDVHWRSISKDNILTIYGKDNNSRIADPADPTIKRIFSWFICETHDDKGNAVLYEYKKEDGVGVDLTHVHERNRGGADDVRRTANRYLKRIHYGNRTSLLDNEGQRPHVLTTAEIEKADWMFEVVLDYDDHDTVAPEPRDDKVLEAGALKYPWSLRQDPFSTYRPGFEVRTARLCQRVLMFHHFEHEAGVGNNCLVRSTDFEYSHEQNPNSARNPVYTFLRAVTQTGYQRHDANSYLPPRSLPPLEFIYSPSEVQDTVEVVDQASLENLPIGVDGSLYQWIDLHGEGIPGILTEQADNWYYKRNISPISEQPVEFTPLEPVKLKPNATLAGGAQIMDLAGDGQPDLVMLDDPTPGFYEHDGEEGWQNFRPFISLPNRNTRDPNLKFIDLNGDGHADLLISEDDAFVWHASLAEEGFGPARRVIQSLDEEKGPRLIFADGTQSIYLTDLSGDGLPDIARIRNGEICYWPNLGYARFGARVTMDRAPHFDRPDQFDQQRIRLADIDGSGTTDIIYLHADGVHLYFNQSGNSWSEKQPLPVFPPVHNLANVTVTDLLGNGTACLVWSSPLPGDAQQPMRYVNLMGDKKPHLLERSINNLGAETLVHYAPSTRFYLQDRRDGNPWVTKLPFPVHVVERVETFDHISRNRFATRYAYHHGYFDGVEREFRGFGMVEQWDTEEYAALSGNNPLALNGEQGGENIEIASHLPPVRTKTWYHTGAYVGRDRISNYFVGSPNSVSKDKYFSGDAEAHLLEDTILPDEELTIDEEREACRSLKGQMLRQEVYADDDPDKAQYPYTVTEQNFTIKRLQPKGLNKHAVFFTHAREALSYHYERNRVPFLNNKRVDEKTDIENPLTEWKFDPRIQHAMTLEVDDYGNVLKSVAIGYGRRPGMSELKIEGDREKQTQRLINYTENEVTNAINDPVHYRTPLPWDVRTYELTGLPPENDNTYFSFHELTKEKFTKIRTLTEVAYEYTPPKNEDNPVGRKRLIEHLRTFYRSNNLKSLLKGDDKLESLALPGESYKLAFTPGLLDKVYKRNGKLLLPEDEKEKRDLLGGKTGDQGGYVDLDENNCWWIPSGKIFYDPGAKVEKPEDTAEDELKEAKSHFFLPQKFTDPFNNSSTIEYQYDLTVVIAEDAINNRVVAEYDYRVLQPKKIVDPNYNVTIVAFDALGLVVGTAVQGKINSDSKPESGDELDNFKAGLGETTRRNFVNAVDPRARAKVLLKNATTRIVYNLEYDSEQGLYPFAATIARETHVGKLKNGETSDLQISFSYSDGFGREIQKKIQAEPENINGPLRWVGNGWTIFNNKGKPVRQYEPFFSQLPEKQHQFEFGEQVGVSPIFFYDPVGRVVATIHPNHTWEKVVFSPWHQTTYDVNDTVTFNPAADNDINGFLLYPDGTPRLPTDEYLPTWHQLRTDLTHLPAFEEQYPDVTNLQRQREAAEKTEAHTNTPTIAHFDSLGRPFLTIAHNNVVCPNHALDGTENKFHTRVELDIEGNQRAVHDADKRAWNADGTQRPDDELGRIVMAYDYYMAGPEQDEEGDAPNRIHQINMEAGARWMLNDVMGNPIRAWDSRGHSFITEYDPLRRPLRTRDIGADPDNPNDEFLSERLVYGEQHPQALQHNLRGKLYLHLDQAGAATTESADFKGNSLHAARRLATEYKQSIDWTAIEAVLPSDATIPFNPVVLEAALAPLLEADTYTSYTTYDALNRPLTATSPDGSIYHPTFNEANLLEKVDVNLRGATVAAPFVKNIDYDAKGQRKLIEYGSGATGNPHGVTTNYDYDPFTFRLVKMTTRRPQNLNGLAIQLFKNPVTVQDLHYTYDPAGNITHIVDNALLTVHHNGQQIDPLCNYTYDALYRLIEATGREQISQSAFLTNPPNGNYRDYPFAGANQLNNPQALRNYTERYVYDAVGNFESMGHHVANGGWTRTYAYEEDSLIEANKKSNRLSKAPLQSEPPSAIKDFDYDPHGSMMKMPHLPLMRWDYRDQLRATAQQVVINGIPETTWYVYDASGQRVRKVTESMVTKEGVVNGDKPVRLKERIYLSGFEIYREYENHVVEPKLERESLHIMDDKQRIALVETKTIENRNTVNSPVPLQRYQLGNHLGSASLELAEDGALISYEEYTPYGSSSFQAGRSAAEVSLKRYRYSGKERDEESGLYYYGARYYAVWLGRWLNCDPVGILDGDNLYGFVNNSPIVLVDEIGTQSSQIYDIPVDMPERPVEWNDKTGLWHRVLSTIDLKGNVISDPILDPGPSDALTNDHLKFLEAGENTVELTFKEMLDEGVIIESENGAFGFDLEQWRKAQENRTLDFSKMEETKVPVPKAWSGQVTGVGLVHGAPLIASGVAAGDVVGEVFIPPIPYIEGNSSGLAFSIKKGPANLQFKISSNQNETTSYRLRAGLGKGIGMSTSRATVYLNNRNTEAGLRLGMYMKGNLKFGINDLEVGSFGGIEMTDKWLGIYGNPGYYNKRISTGMYGRLSVESGMELELTLR